MANDIPECVLESLAVVRSDGATNMLARNVVIMLVDDLCDDYEAVAWLEDNKDRYMEALKAMGARLVH